MQALETSLQFPSTDAPQTEPSTGSGIAAPPRRAASRAKARPARAAQDPASNVRRSSRRSPRSTVQPAPRTFEQAFVQRYGEPWEGDPPDAPRTEEEEAALRYWAKLVHNIRQGLAERGLRAVRALVRGRPLALRLIALMENDVTDESEQAAALGVPVADVMAERKFLRSLRERVYTKLAKGRG